MSAHIGVRHLPPTEEQRKQTMLRFSEDPETARRWARALAQQAQPSFLEQMEQMRQMQGSNVYYGNSSYILIDPSANKRRAPERVPGALERGTLVC